MGFGSFASFSQFFLYGRRHCTRTGYERTRAALLKNGPDFLESVDASGKVYVVTGANSGCGKEIALFLAKKGASVVMICRSAQRGEDARRSIVEESGNAKVSLHVADVSLEADVRSTWAAISASTDRLDGLLCNAGVLLNEKTLTKEGIETTFACHLLFGTYLLGSLAMPLLEATPASRVVVVSSGGMYNTRWPAWDIATAQSGTYNGNLSYAYAKRGQVLLCERWSEICPSVKFVSCHPGWTQTPAVDAAYDAQTKKYLEPLRSPWEGAEGIAWLCVAPSEELVSGAFYLDRKAEPKHLAGAFFSEGSYTKNSAQEVDEMMTRLHAWANGGRREDEAASAAAAAGKAARKSPLVERATPIEVDKFMGKWYVVAAVPTPFDRGAVNSTEEYRWNETKKRIDVSFRMQAAFGAPVKEIPQRATIVNSGINTRWSLSPSVGGVYVPVTLAYLIVDCADDYSSTIIGTPSRSVLYVMTRTPTPTEETVSALLATCERVGYDLSKVVRVAHELGTDGSAAPASEPASMSPAASERAAGKMPVPRTVPGKAFSGPPRLCMATMTPSHNGSNAKKVMDAITDVAGGKYSTWFVTFPRGSTSPYYAFVEGLKSELPEESRAAFAGRYGWSAPFVWLEQPDGTRQPIGGRDALCAWALETLTAEPQVVKAAKAPLRWLDSVSYSAKPGSATAPIYTTQTQGEEVCIVPPTPPTVADVV